MIVLIKIYSSELSLEENNKKLSNILISYFEFNETDEDKDDAVKQIFPSHIYRTNRDKCHHTAKELVEWTQDKVVHTLTPLHE